MNKQATSLRGHTLEQLVDAYYEQERLDVWQEPVRRESLQAEGGEEEAQALEQASVAPPSGPFPEPSRNFCRPAATS